jgi:MFS family permease
MSLTRASSGSADWSPLRRRVLPVACGAHFLHDGLVDVRYFFLPLWQTQFGLTLAQAGLLKTVYSGTMAGLQVPAGLAAERLGERSLLALGTFVSGAAFAAFGFSGGFFELILFLTLAGLGSSVQHPLSSSLVARVHGGARLRAALGTYNFAGDLGKIAVPAIAAVIVAGVAWPTAAMTIGAAAMIGAATIGLALRGSPSVTTAEATGTSRRASDRTDRAGFAALSAIAIIDSGTRTGFLTLLPFLLTVKGADASAIGLALSLVFAGGATGKFICGHAAARLGIIRTVMLTELATAFGILSLTAVPLGPALALLPPVGLALNGTSSVLYGTVPELVPEARRARAFGIFYTLSIGAGAIAPLLYGLVSDAVGLRPAVTIVSMVVAAVLPVAVILRPRLEPR